MPKKDNYVLEKERLVDIYPTIEPPFFLGAHPKATIVDDKEYVRFFKENIRLSNFYNAIHPSVQIIPRSINRMVVDEYGDFVRPTVLPFSSSMFFADFEEDEFFSSWVDSCPYWRLGDISQLGYLIPNNDVPEGGNVYYYPPTYPHTRWVHCILAGILSEIVLARNGVPFSSRAKIVITIGTHDIAMPAGGDSVIRISPDLHEENNYAYVINKYGLDKKWRVYGYDLNESVSWVKNKDWQGFLLDVLDKMSYTALDSWQIGYSSPGELRDLLIKNPLIMDVWEDIRIDVENRQIYFVSPERLYNFLLLRSLEHKEILLNPRSRALDFYIEKLVRPLYEKGVLTREMLLEIGNHSLEVILQKEYPGISVSGAISPEDMNWQRFKTEEEQKKFANSLGSRFDHLDRIKGFETGLDWPVEHNGEIVPLKSLLSSDETSRISGCVDQVKGYYVYYLK